VVAIQTLYSLNFKSNTLLSKCQRTIIVILIILIINVLNTLNCGTVILILKYAVYKSNASIIKPVVLELFVNPIDTIIL